MTEHIQIKKTKKTKKKKHELNDSDDDDEVALAVLFALPLPLLLLLLLLPSSSHRFLLFLSSFVIFKTEEDRQTDSPCVWKAKEEEKKFGENLKKTKQQVFGGTFVTSKISYYDSHHYEIRTLTLTLTH